MNKKEMNNKGFSLVELIIVIAIMAILIGVLAPQFIKYVEKSRESTDITNLDTCVSAVKVYYADRTFPTSIVVAPDTNGKFTATITGGGSTDDPLGDAGCDNSYLKSGKWTGLKATITSGKVEYEGTADYYKPNSSKSGYDPK